MSNPDRQSPHPVRRVLFVINDLGLGGAQRVVLSQAACLDRGRFVAEVASLELDPAGDLVPAFESAGIRVHRLRGPKEPAWRVGPRLDALLKQLRPDLVHTHLAASGVVGRPAARRHRVPRIVTSLHNLTDWEEKRADPVRWLDRFTLPLAHTIVAVSDAVRGALVRVLPELAARTITVRNGVAVEELWAARAGRAQMRQSLGYADEDLVIGVVARLDPRKGLDTLIDAVAWAAPQAPRLRLLVVGDGPERARLRSLAHIRGLGDRIRFVHHQTRVHEHLSAMDLFAAPSRTEGLGIAIIEALAAGLPVLASRVGGIPEVVGDRVCGLLLPPDAPGRWGEELIRLAEDRGLLETWARAAPERARRFSLQRSSLELQRVYDRAFGAEQTEAAEAAA